MQQPQELTLWERFTNFLSFSGESIINWGANHPIQASGVGIVSVGIGIVIGVLSLGSLPGVLSAIIASLGVLTGGTYLGADAYNKERENNRLIAQIAAHQSRSTELQDEQTRVTQENLILQGAAVQHQATINRLHETRRNDAARQLTEPVVNIPAQAAPAPSTVSIFQRTTTQTRARNAVPDVDPMTINPN